MSEPEYVEIGGHTVHPEHRTRAECPECDDVRDLYHLGGRYDDETDTSFTGWVCPDCEEVLEEEHGPNGATVDLRVADGGM